VAYDRTRKWRWRCSFCGMLNRVSFRCFYLHILSTEVHFWQAADWYNLKKLVSIGGRRSFKVGGKSGGLGAMPPVGSRGKASPPKVDDTFIAWKYAILSRFLDACNITRINFIWNEEKSIWRPKSGRASKNACPFVKEIRLHRQCQLVCSKFADEIITPAVLKRWILGLQLTETVLSAWRCMIVWLEFNVPFQHRYAAISETSVTRCMLYVSEVLVLAMPGVRLSVCLSQVGVVVYRHDWTDQADFWHHHHHHHHHHQRWFI